MIEYLKGTLTEKTPTHVVVDVGGVGYGVHVSVITYEQLGDLATEVTLLTYLHVREDLMQLYGFFEAQERVMFELLIAVSGIGPRSAQSMLSKITVEDLRQAIVSANLDILTTIPGIGRKTAQRMVVELKDKLEKFAPSEIGKAGIEMPRKSVSDEAMLALISLGYKKTVAEKAILTALKEVRDPEVSVEKLIRTALKNVAG